MEKNELISKIIAANKAFVNNMPYLTDTEYDKLWKQLYDIDPDNPVLYHTTQDATLPVYHVPHIHKIMGTNKAFCMEDLKPFMARFGHTQLVLEPKYDGCAAVFYKGKEEKDDKLILEGNGEFGRDVTHHLPNIWAPTELRCYESVELIIPNDLWKKEYGKNVRSTVAGWLAKAELEHKNTICMVPHDGEFYINRKYSFNGDYDKLLELLLSCFGAWSKIYKIDGIMIKVANHTDRLVSGNNGTTSNWSIAWKPPIQTKETFVTSVEWNVSRTGRVIPTVLYEPITLCNTLCSRATGNNAQWLRDMNIKSGTTITVGKAGEIIPKIISASNPTDLVIKLPDDCPICGSTLTWRDKDLICESSKCIMQLTKSIAYFYSDKGMEVKTIGENMIHELLQNYLIYSVLSEKPWALLDPIHFGIYDTINKVWGAARTHNYMEALADIKGKKHAGHFIASLGLPGLAYKTAVKLIHYIQHGESKSHIPQKAVNSFIKALGQYYLVEPVLQNFSFIPVPPPAKITYCITGKLSSSRSDMIKYLETYSWHFSNQVSKFTDILIVGQEPGRTKTMKAKELNIMTIREEDISKFIKKEKA